MGAADVGTRRSACVVALQGSRGQPAAALQRLLDCLDRRGMHIVLAEAGQGAGGRLTAYAAGIRALGRADDWECLLLLDDSFVAFNPEQLLERAMTPFSGLDVASLTLLARPEPHLQSYWLMFQGRSVLGSRAFRECWDRTENLTDLQLTRQLAGAGLRLGSLFRPGREHCIVAICRALAWGALPLHVPASGSYVLDPAIALTLDPTVFLWDELMAHFGIVPLGLFSTTAYHVNLGALQKWLTDNPAAATLFEEAATRFAGHALG